MIRIVLFTLSALYCSGLYAETLEMPVEQQPGQSQAISRPAQGTTMDSVKEALGSPLSIQGPVGNPPITQWRYDQFVVYFEYDKVIHTVPLNQPLPPNNP